MAKRDGGLRDSAVRIVQRLRQAGYVAYLAGGCVRDALLGQEPKDYDIATDARPEAVRKLFRRSQFVGEAFGVVLVYEAGRSMPGIEVATFRTEWGYEDGRRPSGVDFTDAEHDAQRRDFTVNGLFADPLNDRLEPVEPGQDRVIDFVSGRADLDAGVLRAIGDPDARFREDYLRMLRAARFASRLGFKIDPATESAIRASASNLSKISRERIGQEVMLMLTGANPLRAAELIQRWELDGPTLDEGHVDLPLRALGGVVERDVDRGSTAAASQPAALGGVTYALVLAAWMLDRAGASGSLADAALFVREHAKEKVRRWRRSLCLSNGVRDELAKVLDLLPVAADWAGLSLAKRKRLLAESAWAMARSLVRVLGPDEQVQRLIRESEHLIADGVSPQPFISGDDLIGMGVPAGPRIGELLDAVYDAQLEGRVTDREQALGWIEQVLRSEV